MQMKLSAALAHILPAVIGFRHEVLDSSPPMPSRRSIEKQQRKRMIPTKEAQVRIDLINRMTNWQRNQWGKAGHSLKLSDLERFSTMPHHKKART
jgi:hypothetical protein